MLDKDTLKNELQDALIDGWKELKLSESFKVYTTAFEFFKNVGLYEGLFRPHIPNPVYDNAAKEMGKYFLNKAFDMGLCFKDLFPGDFKLSVEEKKGDKEYRIFYLTAYYQQNKFAILKIIFEHTHDKFDFPTPPVLEVV